MFIPTDTVKPLDLKPNLELYNMFNEGNISFIYRRNNLS